MGLLVMLVDRERALRELGISEKMLNELLDIFIEQTEQALNSLEEPGNHYEEIQKKAHFINGSSGNLRIDQIKEIAKAIEIDAMEKKDRRLIEENIKKLRTVFEALKKETCNG
jgi:HPt (histidine-containing phosphotransfer) domain-containing protein